MIWAAFILGLLGSWHCLAMCGPIALIVPMAQGKNKVYSILLYHTGKIITYMLIGLLVGSLAIFIESFKVQAIITIAVGGFIALIALVPAILNRMEKKGYKLFNGYFQFKNRIAKYLKKDRLDYSFYIGVLNGFIPCGLVYVAALGALAQTSYLEGMVFMLFFGLGTAPLMSVLLYFSDALKQRFKKYSTSLRVVAMSSVGVFMLWQGVSQYSKVIQEPQTTTARETQMPVPTEEEALPCCQAGR